MSAWLERLLGRIPIGWLQLRENRARTLAALAGVAFANVLVFVQLGILGALSRTIELPYRTFRADLVVCSEDCRMLGDGSPLSRRLLYRALAVPGVAAAAPLYLAQLDWTLPSGATAKLQVCALPPEAGRFAGEAIGARLEDLALAEHVLLDPLTRGVEARELAELSPESPYTFEANAVSLRAVGSLPLGGGFSTDGTMMSSDETFLRLFPDRRAGTPSLLLLDAAPGVDPEALVARVAEQLRGEHVRVSTRDAFLAADRAYQFGQRPVGWVFGFGVFLGVLVGLVVVYQVLATDVADHLSEYATFKAIGYPHRFFLGIVLEEAVLLALLGCAPAVMLAMGLYAAMARSTRLPVEMTATRAIAVLCGTVLACALSGALAARRLRRADPAELF
jgi:putative ABC transport system permease protein